MDIWVFPPFAIVHNDAAINTGMKPSVPISLLSVLRYLEVELLGHMVFLTKGGRAGSQQTAVVRWGHQDTHWPWLVWLSGLSAGLRTERSPV